jgi:hypothetical protein
MEYEYISVTNKRAFAILEEEGIRYSLQKAGAEEQHYYRYEEIRGVKLFVAEANWYSIVISFSNSAKLQLKSVSRDPLKSNKLVQKMNSQDLDYRNWVVGLHDRLISKRLGHSIKFSQGRSFVFIGLIILMAFVVLAFLAALAISQYGLAVMMASGLLFLFLYARHIGFVKPYDPTVLPDRYLPVV